MDIATVGQLIGTLGFPIVACGGLFWMINNNEKARRDETAKMTEAINNNTIAITKLVSKIGGDE